MLAGLSLGGFLGPRAASKEHRLAALIADSGSFDLYAVALERMPKPLADGYEAGTQGRRAALSTICSSSWPRSRPAGWGLRRGMVVHGVDSPLAYLDVLKDFRLRYAETISCPTLVTHAEADDIGATAPHCSPRSPSRTRR